MSKGTCIRVSTEIEGNGVRATVLWVVATSDPDEALRAVKARVTPACIVELTDHPVAENTIQRRGLAPGQACPYEPKTPQTPP